ncbi:MAG: undecaprenyl-diphosphate phosphatase [Candidatus Heimdallarchaeota archaeon]|nr:undecaprenyl-diphosphate phosphatase [Candidatus Heimdallarchaeota archaeon]
MDDILAAVLMAIFQGIFEWLPISSEGQLSLLFVTIYQMDQVTAVTLALLLHLGTMMAVTWYFREYLKEIINPRSQILQIMILSTLGTAITAVPLVLLFKTSWLLLTENLILPADFIFTSFIGILLIITGLVLSKQPEQGSRELPSLTSNEAFVLGLTQGIAALPGISRSGMTITFLLLIGLTHRDALKISFLISIPAVLGATALEFLLAGFTLSISGITVGDVFFSYPILLFSILLTALIGYLTMDSLIKLKKIPYAKFCIGFGILTITLGLLFLMLQVVSQL